MKNSSGALPRQLLPASLIGTLLLAGCVGTLGGDDEKEEPTVGDGDETNTPSSSGQLPDLDEIDCTAVPLDPGPRIIPLLSRAQYLNTLEEVIGVIPGVKEALATYVAPSTLGVPQAPANANDVEGYERAATLIATHVVTNQELLNTLAPCAEGQEPAACARTFLETFAARAYRAPLLDEQDFEAHLALFSVGLETSYERGIELLLRGILQAPRFLYQLEIGTGDPVSESAVRLRPHELAARLSYALWDTPPDAALLEAAAAGALDTDAGLLAQVDRLLSDPRGAHFVSEFLEAWTHLERVQTIAKDSDLYPVWPSIQEATFLQGRAFFDYIVNERGASLTELLTSPVVMVNDTLAPHYGVTAGPDFEAFDAPKGTPSGLLTLPSLMATFAKTDESSPIHRGVFVREALLCQSPPAPPDLIPPAPEVDAGGSTRDRLAQHTVDPACAGCHQLLDPVGLGLENYDAIGFFRSEDGGKPVDASGELLGTDVNGAFEGAAELGQMLLESETVEQCINRQFFRYVLSRFEDDEKDLCSVKSLVSAFRASDQSLSALPHAVVQTAAFRYRRPSDAEIMP